MALPYWPFFPAVDGTAEQSAHLRLLRQFAQLVDLRCARHPAVDFLQGYDIGRDGGDDIGQSCKVGGAVHACTVMDIVTENADCIQHGVKYFRVLVP